MVFHLNYCKKNFRPLFCHFLSNSAIIRLPIFSGHGQLLGACFALFCRKFGHLVAVLTKLKLVQSTMHGHIAVLYVGFVSFKTTYLTQAVSFKASLYLCKQRKLNKFVYRVG
jgi:hypothetical protein